MFMDENDSLFFHLRLQFGRLARQEMPSASCVVIRSHSFKLSLTDGCDWCVWRTDATVRHKWPSSNPSEAENPLNIYVCSGSYLAAHALLFYEGHPPLLKTLFPYSLWVLGLLISIKDKFHSKRQLEIVIRPWIRLYLIGGMRCGPSVIVVNG